MGLILIMNNAVGFILFQRSSRNSKSVTFREEQGQGQGQEAAKKAQVQEAAPRKNNGQYSFFLLTGFKIPIALLRWSMARKSASGPVELSLPFHCSAGAVIVLV